MRVFVYFNLHKKCWSVKALEGPCKGRVVRHARLVYLTNVTPKVSEAGRQRVIRTGRKNVHAGIVGTLQFAADDDSPSGWFKAVLREKNERFEHADMVTYNPYKFETFVNMGDKAMQLRTASRVFMDSDLREVLVAGASWYIPQFDMTRV
jgi:hypothetical protein